MQLSLEHVDNTWQLLEKYSTSDAPEDPPTSTQQVALTPSVPRAASNTVVISSDSPTRTAHFCSPCVAITHSLPTQTQYLRNGWTSWSASSWWWLDRDPWRVWNNPSRTLTAEDASTDSQTIHQSYMMSCLKLDERTSLLIGCLSPTTALIRFEEGAIRATSLDCNPDLELNWFLAIGTENECLSAYTHELRTLFPQHNLPEEYFGAVWSSWYSWFEEITAEHIQQEIKPAAELGYTILQIDDGWERAVGDWEANQDFPGGMSEIASEISDQDLIPGLWIAPFIAMEDTPLVAQHPEYFVHDDDGALKPAGYNWGQYYYGLDCTHPGAQEWLRQLLRKVRSWGYSYFKLDFLNAAAIEGTRLDNIDREMAYRTGLDIVREELDDCYIMASGAVIAPSLGLVDGMRIGPDTAPYWDNTDRFRDPTGPAVRNALRNVMARYWLHGVAHIDPDVVFARTHGSLLSPEVNHITHDLARVCGVLGCSDPAQWLTDEQRTEIRSLCEEFSQTNNRPEIEHLSRYVFTIAGRNVDFEPWIYPDGRISDRILVK